LALATQVCLPPGQPDRRPIDLWARQTKLAAGSHTAAPNHIHQSATQTRSPSKLFPLGSARRAQAKVGASRALVVGATTNATGSGS